VGAAFQIMKPLPFLLLLGALPVAHADNTAVGGHQAGGGQAIDFDGAIAMPLPSIPFQGHRAPGFGGTALGMPGVSEGGLPTGTQPGGLAGQRQPSVSPGKTQGD
jgi:hypothetical protein